MTADVSKIVKDITLVVVFFPNLHAALAIKPTAIGPIKRRISVFILRDAKKVYIKDKRIMRLTTGTAQTKNVKKAKTRPPVL